MGPATRLHCEHPRRQKFAEALDKTGVPLSIRSYDGAPHSFFDRRYAEWKEACDDAWARIFRFIEEN